MPTKYMQEAFDYQLFTDTYFLRSLMILKAENLNPYVRYQVFFRGESGVIDGVEEAIDFLKANTKFVENGGSIWSLRDGEMYAAEETVMVLEGFVQDLIATETVLLGILSGATTLKNNEEAPRAEDVKKKIRSLVSLVEKRPVIYFGARHFHYKYDELLSKAAFEGGASDCSTDNGAKTVGKKGVGTIPHALECIYAWKYGIEKAVLESTKAFDKIIDPDVPRIALIDFANHEIDDTLQVAQKLGERLYGVRIDTAGENLMQGQGKIVGHEADPHWAGKGVSIGGVYTLKKTLLSHGFGNVKIVLSGGFGNPEKVKAFVDAEKELGIRLFDTLGVGEVAPGRFATMDIVGVGEKSTSIMPVAKVGRRYKENKRLTRVY